MAIRTSDQRQILSNVRAIAASVASFQSPTSAYVIRANPVERNRCGQENRKYPSTRRARRNRGYKGVGRGFQGSPIRVYPPNRGLSSWQSVNSADHPDCLALYLPSVSRRTASRPGFRRRGRAGDRGGSASAGRVRASDCRGDDDGRTYWVFAVENRVFGNE
jgi:hypothetical protein